MAVLGNVSHFRVIAAPGAGFVGGVRRSDTRFELGDLLIAEGDGVVVVLRLAHHADGYTGHIHELGDGDGGGQAAQSGPAVVAIIYLELDGNNLVGGGLGHFVVLCRKGEDVAAAAHGDGKGLGSCAVHADEELHGVIFIYIIKVLIAGILVNGDAKCQHLGVRVIAGGEVGDGVLQQGGGDADAGNGDVVYLIGRVAPVIGDAGVGGDAHGQGGVVDLLDLVKESNVLAAGGAVELGKSVLLVVDGDVGAIGVIYFDELIAGDGNGDHVAALVAARRGGDGEGGLDVIVYQIDGAIRGAGKIINRVCILRDITNVIDLRWGNARTITHHSRKPARQDTTLSVRRVELIRKSRKGDGGRTTTRCERNREVAGKATLFNDIITMVFKVIPAAVLMDENVFRYDKRMTLIVGLRQGGIQLEANGVVPLEIGNTPLKEGQCVVYRSSI